MVEVNKKRRLETEEGAEDVTQQQQQLPPHLKEEPADPNQQRITKLEGQLKHLRDWMQGLQNNMQANPMHRDAAFNARRLFVGGVPSGTTDEELAKFLSSAIMASGAAVSSRGRPVIFCRIQRDKNFAFAEVRSAEEASNAMALDGLVFNDTVLKIKRPSKWDQMASMLLGPTEPDPTLDLSQVVISKPPPPAAAGGVAPDGTPLGPQPGPQGAAGGPGRYEASHNTLYIGGLPIEWNTEQCLELLRMYGEVKYFRLMMDRNTGNSRGFAFTEYSTDEATVAALKALDGAQLGPRTIAANRMLEHKQKQQLQQQLGQQQMGMGGMMGMAGGGGGQWGGYARNEFGGGAGFGVGAGGGGMMGAGQQQQQGGYAGGGPAQMGGGYGGGMMQQGGGMGMQAAGAVGMDAGYGMGMEGAGAAAGYAMGMGAAGGGSQPPPPPKPQQQQQAGMGMPYGGVADGGMAAAGMMGGAAGMNQQQQAGAGAVFPPNMQQAVAAAGDMYGAGQMGQGQQQAAGGEGYMYGAGSQQQMPAQQQQQMPQHSGGMMMGGGAAGVGAAGMGGVGAGLQMGGYNGVGGAGMQMGGAAGNMMGGAGMQQPPPPPRMVGGTAAINGPGTGGGNMGNWQQQQPGWM